MSLPHFTRARHAVSHCRVFGILRGALRARGDAVGARAGLDDQLREAVHFF
jgi:hypothetical protein